MAKEEEARVVQYELEIEIHAAKERVWQALTEETNAWWLADFRVIGRDSEVSFTPEAGGALIERQRDGGSLLWYTVQMVSPGETIYLLGHSAADWGGPNVSSLKLHLEQRGESTALRITDSLFGRVTTQQVESLHEGWKTLFGEGLKSYVENAA